MSDYAAREALLRMNGREVAMNPLYTGLLGDLKSMSLISAKDGHEMFLARRGEICAALGFEGGVQSKPFAFAEGLAIIPVTGSLINRFNGSYGYVTGYNFIRTQTMAALADPDVRGIVYDVNTYGGEAAGCFECADFLYQSRAVKPSMAIVDSNAYSAGEALSSAAGKVFVTPSGGVGSIGVVAMHVNMEKALADWGYEVTFIYSGKHKVDGNPYQALPDAVKKDWQAGIDASRQRFATLVDRNRNLKEGTAFATEAQTYRAEDAMTFGLIDAIAAPQEAVSAFLRELSGSKSQSSRKGTSMSKEDTGPANDTAQAAAEARKAERTRIAGITGSEEAKGREVLANHLAMNTEMSVDEAKAILAAAPKAEQKAEQASEPPKAAANPFKTAMDNGHHPKVGADSVADDTSGGGENLSLSQQILRDYTLATGAKFDSKA
jgi:ClpP class serine protease